MRAGCVVAIALLFALPAGAAETPADFMAKLGAKYRAMDHWPRGYEPCAEFCEPALWRLVQHANDGGDAVLDYDPFCQCQDVPPSLPVKSIKTVDATTANVTLQEGDTSWIIVLHQGEGRWRIADVIEKGRFGLGSLKARLAKPPK